MAKKLEACSMSKYRKSFKPEMIPCREVRVASEHIFMLKQVDRVLHG